VVVGASASDTRVFINGEDVSRFFRSVRIESRGGELTTTTLIAHPTRLRSRQAPSAAMTHVTIIEQPLDPEQLATAVAEVLMQRMRQIGRWV
jgi:hypothetical protein